MSNQEPMNEQIPKEAQERFTKFVEGYGKLREETQYDIAGFPSFVPNERGTFDIIVHMQPMDIKDQPTPSPFVPGT